MKRPERTWQSETDYIYDGRRVIQERDYFNGPTVSYTRGNDLSGSLEGAGGIGGLLGRTAHSGTNLSHAFYHADGNGNITCMVNTNQSVVANYRYDPFGNTISKSGALADANLYRFSSKEFHANSGMYYYGYRWYDPFLQRWINRDPIGIKGGRNLYRFVNNNPVSVYDPVGLVSSSSMGCQDPCGQAKKMGLHKNSDGTKAPGGTVCCGGKAYGCVWDSSKDGTVSNQRAQDILAKCIQEHEDTHAGQGECPQFCVVTNKRAKDKKEHEDRECEAYQQSLKCFEASRADCAGDPNCLNQVAVEIKLNNDAVAHYCGGSR